MHSPLFQLFTDAQASLQGSTLYVVATPIGNLTDIGVRALAVLAAADVVCAEDTRVTGQLLRAYGIHVPSLISVREHNEREQCQRILQWLQEGKKVVLVSDAGTPAISDPGARVVQSCHEAGLTVCPIPGPSALTTAVAGAGLQAAQVLFYGFLPPKTVARQKLLQGWQQVDYAVVLYEAPHRIVDCLQDIVTVLGEQRLLVLGRELTKTFETLRRLPAAELLAWVQADSNQQRGECVLIIEQAPPRAQAEDGLTVEQQQLLQTLLRAVPTKQAAQLATELTGVKRKLFYDYALQLKAQDDVE
ncbi:16S rRNA (cytidine(1402)-2'-O)-methyltransferase [Aquaspirillum soli]